MKKLLVFIGLTIGAVLAFNAPPVLASPNVGWCEEVKIPVALKPGDPKNKTISGTHCKPSASTTSHAVDLLIPGGTYDSRYWDFPYNNYQYSYGDKATQAGRATFNLDRIGTGKSSTPLSAAVTLDADVYTLHQVIDWLKLNRNYTDITSVGHSAGSIVAIKEAATHNDTNRIVATGLLHSAGFKLLLDIGGGGLMPAFLDPQFATAGLDPLYLTTTPGKRGAAFYSSSANPAVIQYDEAHKNFISGVEAPSAIGEILLPPALNSSKDVRVPVLTIAGDQDVLCGFIVGAQCSSSASIEAYEKPWYPQSPSYTAKLVPNTGHNLPLHPSADDSFQIISEWIQTH